MTRPGALLLPKLWGERLRPCPARAQVRAMWSLTPVKRRRSVKRVRVESTVREQCSHRHLSFLDCDEGQPPVHRYVPPVLRLVQ